MTYLTKPRTFASDNYAGVHPEIMAAMVAVNSGHEIAYGEDSVTARLDALFQEHFGPDAVAFPVFNGTGANVIALQACTKRWEAVICADTAHIHADEGGAPEKMAGLKLWTVATPDGKLTPELIESQIFDMGVVHRAQPGVVSITNTTEMGTLYTAAEIRAIADVTHKHGLLLHLDGARLSNAAVALGAKFRDFTTDAGVDILSFGGTKIGALAAEAVIVLNASKNATLAEALPFLRKTSMQLASKMRFVSAQLIAIIEGDLWMRNAQNANSMAARLEAGIRALGVNVPNQAQANAVFPIFTAAQTEWLQERFRFYVWNQATGMVRLMCSWDTTEGDVDDMIAAVAEVVSK
jgi:threonine aldolase